MRPGADHDPERGPPPRADLDSTPAALSGIVAEIDLDLDRTIGAESERWSGEHPLLAEMLEALSALVSDGKRLRAALCHWAFVGAGGEVPDPELTKLRTAVELLHTFALLHDDVMDDASHRRGRTTLHHRFDAHHRNSEAKGEARRFGEGVAIIAGDLLHVMADRLMSELIATPRPDSDGNGTSRLAHHWNELRIEVNVGQWLDLIGAAESTAGVDLADRITELKSARYSAVRPLQLGAILAQGDAAPLDELARVGLPLGRSFQLRDDLLGVLGTPGEVGKPVGADLRSGKVTPLLIHARSADLTTAQAALLSRVGTAELEEVDIQQMVETLLAVGSVAAIEARIEALTHEALAAIDASPLTPSSREKLGEIAIFAGRRTS